MAYKIAIVIPTITTISGNRTAFLLAKELNTYMPCVLICYEIEESQIKIVENLLSPVHLFYKKKLKNGKYSIAKGLKDQFLRKRDRDLSKFILQKDHFDVVLIISNEGKYLSYYLKKKNSEIITAIQKRDPVYYTLLPLFHTLMIRTAPIPMLRNRKEIACHKHPIIVESYHWYLNSPHMEYYLF